MSVGQKSEEQKAMLAVSLFGCGGQQTPAPKPEEPAAEEPAAEEPAAGDKVIVGYKEDKIKEALGL